MKKLLIATFALLALTTATAAAQQLNIVFIGNSITQGALIDHADKYAPPAMAASILSQQGYVVNFANCGVSGSTTVDQLPSTATIFNQIVESADTMYRKNGQLIFSIMLGTNDSAESGPNGSPVSAQQYFDNLKLITSQLMELYPRCKIVVHHPIWYSTTTQNSAVYLASGLARLQSYFPQIDRLADNKDIFVGDTAAFAFFEQHHQQYCAAEHGAAGTFYLHPNKEGAEKLAQFWVTAAIQRFYRNAR